ncbi:hypothetical protein AB3M80_03690 [Arthrospira platensis BEA 1257B]
MAEYRQVEVFFGLYPLLVAKKELINNWGETRFLRETGFLDLWGGNPPSGRGG